eukprot:6326078-Pyramimonas_sp.AAC.1
MGPLDDPGGLSPSACPWAFQLRADLQSTAQELDQEVVDEVARDFRLLLDEATAHSLLVWMSPRTDRDSTPWRSRPQTLH